MPELKNSYAEPLPSSSSKPLASWYTQGLSDGLGDRLLMFDNTGAPSLELLRFRPDIGQVPGFETALRDQVHRLRRFRHPAFAAVRSVQRLEPDDDLALISNYTPGKRLSEVLEWARGPQYAVALIKELAPALVLLQQQGAGSCHGVLTADRIVVTPEGRLTIVEHVVGPALDALNLQSRQLASFGIASPPISDSSTPRLDAATDWYQLGLVVLSVLIGRPVVAQERQQVATLLDGLDGSAGPDGPVLSPFMRQWLDRALQISGPRITSGNDGRDALDELLQKEARPKPRRIESPRRQPSPSLTPPPAAPRTPPTEPVTSDVVAAGPRRVVSLSDFVSEHDPSAKPLRPSPAQVQPVRPAAARLSPYELGQVEARDRPMQVGTLFQSYSIVGERKRSLEREKAAVRRDPPAATKPPRRGIRLSASTGVIAALTVIAVIEAVVIASMAHVLWSNRQSAVLVETVPSSENVLISSRSEGAATLRLTTAPDLRWVRVTSPAAAGILGGSAADRSFGTVRISSPIELKVFEQSRLLGSVPGAGLRLAAGRHDIELVNQTFGYRLQQSLEVEAGQTLSIHIAPPHGWVTVHATPNADVSIDGERVGRTPLGPLALSLGEHAVTFQHTSGARDRQRVMVTSGATIRVLGYPRR